MSWSGQFYPDRVEIYKNGSMFVNYELLPNNCCEKCSAPLILGVCSNCEDLNQFRRLYAMGIYHAGYRDGDLSRHILSLKHDRSFAEPLSLALSLVIKNKYPELLKVDCLIPIPIHDDKLEEKGFNQSYQLSYELSKNIHIRTIDCMEQIKNYSQHNSDRATRFQNVSNSFIINPKIIQFLKNKYILLIDDIMTSGATINECAKILKENGVKEVDGLVAGRTG